MIDDGDLSQFQSLPQSLDGPKNHMETVLSEIMVDTDLQAEPPLPMARRDAVSCPRFDSQQAAESW